MEKNSHKYSNPKLIPRKESVFYRGTSKLTNQIRKAFYIFHHNVRNTRIIVDMNRGIRLLYQ